MPPSGSAHVLLGSSQNGLKKKCNCSIVSTPGIGMVSHSIKRN